MLASEIFADLADRGRLLISNVRDKGWAPNHKKTLRTFGITEAAKLVGKNKETIRKNELSGKLPSAKLKNGQRIYTLDDINSMRDYFGTRPVLQKETKAAVIAVMNQKGGVAKTKTSVHLAQDYALKGHRVLLIDGDHQASSTIDMGFNPREDISPNETLAAFFRKPITGVTDQDDYYSVNCLQPLIKKSYFPGLDLIPANLTIQNIQDEMTAILIRCAMVGVSFDTHNILYSGIYGSNEIEGIINDYDIIIIDCPPYLDTLTYNALYAANGIIIPVPPVMTDVSSTVECVENMNVIFSTLPDRDYSFVKILITKHRPSNSKGVKNESNHNANIAQVVKIYFEGRVLVNTMIQSDAIEKTSTHLKTIYDLSPQEFAESLHADRKTLKRALQAAQAVNSEIYSYIQDFWNSQTVSTQIATSEVKV